MRTEDEFLSKMLFEKYSALFLTPEQTSEAIGRAVITLSIDRMNGTGIPYIKNGRSIRYSITAIAKYLNDKTQAVM